MSVRGAVAAIGFVVAHAATASAGPGTPLPFSAMSGSLGGIIQGCNDSEAVQDAVAAGGATILASYSPGGPVIAAIPLPAQLTPPPGLSPDEAGVYQWCPSYLVVGAPPGTYWVTMVVGLVDFTTGSSSTWQPFVLGDRCMGPPPSPFLTATVFPATSTVSLQGFVGPGCSYNAFVVEAGSGPGASNVTVFNLPGSLNFSATAVPAGVYYLRARTVNAFGASVTSPETPVSVPSCTAMPSSGFNLSGSVGPGGTVSVSWSVTANVNRTFLQLIVFRVNQPPVNGADATRVAAPLLSPMATAATLTLPPGTYNISLVGGGPCGTSAAAQGLAVTVP